MKSIISASRRTDIPAFYPEWFLRRLNERFVYVRQPYGGRISRVSLKPDDISCITFWSKNFAPLISQLERVALITQNLFFHFTITGITKDVESGTPPLSEAVHDYIFLSKRYAPDHLIWRFDPICITDKLPFEHYEELFSKIAVKLHGHCSTCYISFVQKYKKVLIAFEKYCDHTLAEINLEMQKEYASRLGRIAEKNGIRLHACCNDHLISGTVLKGSCINSQSLSRVFDDRSINSSPAPTRNQCACTKSIDIGAYDTCPYGCLYCYANTNKEKAQKSFQYIHSDMNGLGFHVEEEMEEKDELRSSLFPLN
jgi:DNA repair photolyase